MKISKIILLLFLVSSLVFCTVSANTGEIIASGGNASIGGGGGFDGPVIGDADDGSQMSGTCGSDAKWVLSTDGTLTISGTGKIDAGAFSNNKVNATKVVIEEGITEIGNYAFERCYSIREVVLPDSLTVLGNQVFMYCSNLSAITMGANITNIPAYTFGYCGFETFTIPDGVTTLGNNAITGDKLKVVYVPDSVTSMHYETFGYNGVVLVGNRGSYAEQYANSYSYNGIVFLSNDNLTIKGSAGPDIRYSLDVINGTLTLNGSGGMDNYDYYGTPWWDYARYITKVVIDDDITSIGNNAFYGCYNLVSVTHGSELNYIGEYAFYECRMLKSLGVMDNITHIGAYAFNHCTSLKDFPAGEKLRYIGDYAFANTQSITELTLHNGIETIKANAFASAYVTNLHISDKYSEDMLDVILPLSVRGNIYLDDDNDNLTVTDNVLMNSAKTTLIKAGYVSGEYNVADSVKTISPYAFYEKEITSINFPDGLENIGKGAFASCSYLRWVSIPASVISIGEYAFNGSYYFTISGYSNTIAEKYANDSGCTFESLGEAPVKEQRVVNSYELMEALKKPINTKVILADGVYAFEEPVSIENAYNLTIVAENPGKAEILTFDGYKPVIEFKKSSDVNLYGLILGHYSLVYRGNNCGSGSYSGGYVLYSEHSENITVDYCDLYGCGTYAAYLSYTGSMNIKNSVLRDCSEGIVYITGRDYSFENTDVYIEDCIISGNAYKEEFANNYPAIVDYNSNTLYVNNCTFVNNYSWRLNESPEVFFEDCRYSDNCWDGYTPVEYGVCLNGITWEIAVVPDSNGEVEKVLKIGFDIDCGDFVIESSSGNVLPYSTSSVPWKGKDYDRIELASGVVYDDSIAHSACGYDMRWTLDKDTGVLDIDGSGRMFEYYHWEYLEDYIKTIYADDDITYVYREALMNTPFYREPSSRIDGLLYIGRNLLDADVDSGTVVIRDGTYSIAPNTFEYCGMTKVIVPDSVTVIPEYAFAYAEKLEEVVLPQTITEIGDYAFQRCIALRKLTIPEKVTKIGNGAFSYCNSLEEIIIPDSVVETGNALFENCTSLKKVKLSDNIKNLSQNMFWECSSLENVDLPQNLTEIEYGAFRDCTSLKEIVIPDGVTYVDSSVFDNCSALTKLTIPASVREFYYCLQNCTALAEIVYRGTQIQWNSMQFNSLADSNYLECIIKGEDFTISPPVVEYEYISYFGGMEITGAKSFVTDLVVPDMIDGYPVKSIAYNAFTDNANIKSVVLPEGLEFVSAEAFRGTAFYNNKDNWKDGILYIGTYLLCADQSLEGDVIIKDGTKYLSEFAFQGCDRITSVSIPQSVECISSGVFSGCTNLKNVVFPYNITELYGEMFYNCTSLESVTLPKNLVEFEPYLFYGCSALKNVYIADGNENYCTVDGVLYDTTKSVLIYYPAGRDGVVVVNSGVTDIARSAFMYSTMEKISLPVTLTFIAEGAFQSCYLLSEVAYEGTEGQWNEICIGEYGNEAIYDAKIVGNGFVRDAVPLRIYDNGNGTASVVHCAGYVKEITIPAYFEGVPVTAISDWAFENCVMLEKINVESGNEYFKSVDGVLFTADMKTLIKYPAKKSTLSYTVPETVESLQYSSFAYSILEEITLSPNIIRLENYIFEGCNNLKKVVVLEGTQAIGYALFANCQSLETVVIPESVNVIENYAFNNCKKLKTIQYAGSKSDWNYIYIGDFNEYLEKAQVIYGKIAPAVKYTDFTGVEYLPDDEIAVVCVYVEGINETFTMLAAIYDENDRMTAMEKVTVSFDKDGRVVTVPITSVKSNFIPKLKLFFWGDENISKPVGKPIVLENLIV